MSVVRQGVAVKRPCNRYTVTREDTISGEMVTDMSMRKYQMIESDFLEILRNNTKGDEDGNKVASLKRERTAAKSC